MEAWEREKVLSEDLLEKVFGFFSFGQWTKAIPKTMTRTQPCPFEFQLMATSSHFSAIGLRLTVRPLSSSQKKISLHLMETFFPT